jgi:hypothetical protein
MGSVQQLAQFRAAVQAMPVVDRQLCMSFPLGDLCYIHMIPYVVVGLGNPFLWTNAFYNISSLTSQEWIDAACVDFHLGLYFIQQSQKMVNHIPLTTSMLFCQDEVGPGHLQDLKRSTMPYVQGRPIAFLVYHSSHFFVVVFDYAQQKAYVIGRSIHGHSNGLSWSEWHGPQLWIRVPSVCDVSNVCTPEEVTLTTVDWVHVS